MNDEELDYLIENKVYGMGYDTYEEDGHSDFAVEKIIKEIVAPFNKQIKELEKEVDEVKLKSGYCVYLEDKIKIDELEAEIGRLKLNEQNLSNENEKLRQKIVDMRNQWDKLENDIKDVSNPKARYNIDDLIEDWDIR